MAPALRPAVRRAVDSSSVTSHPKVLFSWQSFQGMLMLLVYYNIIIPGVSLHFAFLILLCLVLLFKKGFFFKTKYVKLQIHNNMINHSVSYHPLTRAGLCSFI